jgi:Domain of Unknown Function (DUF1080)
MHGFSLAFAALLFTAVHASASDETKTFTFSKDDVGKLPMGWKADKTGLGEGSVWKVVADETTPSKSGYALAQTAEGPSKFFNLCIAEDAQFTDLEIAVEFKAVKGKEDQGGGVVWRFKDANNYYICRMNPLEDNFRVYKVVEGKRMQLETTKDDVKAPANEWHTIKVKMKGEEIECFLDGKKLLEAKDGTFKEAGKIGLWSKADAQTHFDKLTVKGK